MTELAASAMAGLPCRPALKYRTTPLATVVAMTIIANWDVAMTIIANGDVAIH